MSKRRTHSKIDKLPIQVRTQIDKKLVAGDTYAQIAKYLQELGYDINQMCICRYAKPVLKQFEAIKTAKDRAKAILSKKQTQQKIEFKDGVIQ